jgi:hypothetical protein
MCVHMDTNTTKPKRANYKKILDTNITDKQRKIGVNILNSSNAKEIAKESGVNVNSVYQSLDNPDVVGGRMAIELKKANAMEKILTFCEDILNTEIDTPLKASDKVAAARLYAEISGVMGKEKGDTHVHVGVYDLRNASENELLAELARIEKMRVSAIDSTAIVTHNNIN